ncbi:MAG: DUF1963 domain-containing protein [Clostridia bacterium]|nr:DUF1963 domain-containing protein [Clostridia bacterium]
MTIEEIYEEVKKETGVTSYKIVKEKADNLTIFDSKFGGIPYWDFSEDFPKDTKGEKLMLLAQINFEKDKFKDERLPEKGILQFFISSNDDVYGMNFDEQDKQTDWRVVYHESINYEITEEEIRNNGVITIKEVSPDYYAPFNDSYKISFKPVSDVLSIYDGNFNSIVVKILKEKFNVNIEERDVEDYLEKIDEKFYNKFETWGHKLLGYPAFTQSDPRFGRKDYSKYDTLLLQIDSDDEIMWGDCGVANFFINKEDLMKKDFSNVLYNWDCC